MIKRLIINMLLALSLLPLLAAPLQASSIPKPEYLIGPSASSDTNEAVREELLYETIPNVINRAIGILGIGAFLGILISAINMLISYGNEDRINRAKTALRYSLIGFAIVVFSYAIVSIVVAVALPKEAPPVGFEWLIPTAHAVGLDDVNTLLPSQYDIIEGQDPKGRVSLPSGDLVTEIVPGIVTNIMYFIGFLIFIAITMGGAMLVYGRGNEEQTKKAKTIMTWGAIALALVTLGYSIIYGIATINLQADPTSTADDVFVPVTDRAE